MKLPLATKWSTPCEKVLKTVPENGVFSCVPFCFRSLGRFERCDSAPKCPGFLECSYFKMKIVIAAGTSAAL